MRLVVQYGVWRSPLGDTWPHDETVEMDWWPQGTHFLHRSSGLVLCASGAGGGSQQAMFRSHLDPLLARAHGRWLEGFKPSAPSSAELDRLFAAIQREFEELREPAWAEQFQASAVALLVGGKDCAVANVGVDRAWLLRDGRLEGVSEDYTLESVAGPGLPEPLRDLPGSSLGRFGGAVPRWQVRRVARRAADIFVLASGFRDTGVSEAQLAAELEHLASDWNGGHSNTRSCGPSADLAAARLGRRLAEIAASVEGRDERRIARWHLHSRLALAVVQLAAAT